MKKGFLFFLSLLGRLVAAVLAGVLLLALVYCIPARALAPNVRRSVEIIEAEGLYPELTPYATSNLDTWTDSIMLLEAVFPTEGSPFVNAMEARRYVSGEGFPTESLVRWLREDGAYDYIEPYPQYWHGYLVLLKPLLALLDYGGIRILNGTVQLLLDAAIALLLWRRGRQAYILPYLFSVGMLMPLALAKCLQFSSCFYLFSLASLALLLLPPEKLDGPKALLVFFYTGVATAFFDFLTYPIAAFGVPAVFFLLLRGPRANGEQLRRLAAAFLIWALGYGGMWLGKLVAGSLITGTSLFQAAGGHVGQWFNGERWFSVGYVFYFNVRDFVYTPASLTAFGLAVVLLVKLLRLPRGQRNLAQALPFLLLALLPFAWYLFLFNPSGVHHFFTNKACVVSAFAGLSMLTALSRQNEKA